MVLQFPLQCYAVRDEFTPFTHWCEETIDLRITASSANLNYQGNFDGTCQEGVIKGLSLTKEQQIYMKKGELEVYYKDSSSNSSRMLEGIKILWKDKDDSNADYNCYHSRAGDDSSSKSNSNSVLDDIEDREYPITRVTGWYTSTGIMSSPTFYISNGKSFTFDKIDNNDKTSGYSNWFDWSAASGQFLIGMKSLKQTSGTQYAQGFVMVTTGPGECKCTANTASLLAGRPTEATVEYSQNTVQDLFTYDDMFEWFDCPYVSALYGDAYYQPPWDTVNWNQMTLVPMASCVWNTADILCYDETITALNYRIKAAPGLSTLGASAIGDWKIGVYLVDAEGINLYTQFTLHVICSQSTIEAQDPQPTDPASLLHTETLDIDLNVYFDIMDCLTVKTLDASLRITGVDNQPSYDETIADTGTKCTSPNLFCLGRSTFNNFVLTVNPNSVFSNIGTYNVEATLSEGTATLTLEFEVKVLPDCSSATFIDNYVDDPDRTFTIMGNKALTAFTPSSAFQYDDSISFDADKCADSTKCSCENIEVNSVAFSPTAKPITITITDNMSDATFDDGNRNRKVKHTPTFDFSMHPTAGEFTHTVTFDFATAHDPPNTYDITYKIIFEPCSTSSFKDNYVDADRTFVISGESGLDVFTPTAFQYDDTMSFNADKCNDSTDCHCGDINVNSVAFGPITQPETISISDNMESITFTDGLLRQVEHTPSFDFTQHGTDGTFTHTVTFDYATATVGTPNTHDITYTIQFEYCRTALVLESTPPDTVEVEQGVMDDLIRFEDYVDAAATTCRSVVQTVKVHFKLVGEPDSEWDFIEHSVDDNNIPDCDTPCTGQNQLCICERDGDFKILFDAINNDDMNHYDLKLEMKFISTQGIEDDAISEQFLFKVLPDCKREILVLDVDFPMSIPEVIYTFPSQPEPTLIPFKCTGDYDGLGCGDKIITYTKPGDEPEISPQFVIETDGAGQKYLKAHGTSLDDLIEIPDTLLICKLQILPDLIVTSITDINSSILECQIETFEFETPISDQTYNVEANAIEIPFANAVQTPACNFTLAMETEVLINGKSKLPDWLKVDLEGGIIKIETSDPKYAGSYSLTIRQTLNNTAYYNEIWSQSVATMEAKISINKNDPIIINNLPKVEGELSAQTMYPGNSTIYEIIVSDLEVEDTFSTEIDLGDAEGFITYTIDEGSGKVIFDISPDVNVSSGTYTVQIKMTALEPAPNAGDDTTQSFDIVIEEIPEPEPKEIVVEEEIPKFDSGIVVKETKEEEEEEEIKLTVEVEYISNLAEVLIPFSHPVIVPDNWSNYTQEDLLVEFINNSGEDIKGFKYNLTEFTQDYLTIVLGFDDPLLVSVGQQLDELQVFLSRTFFMNINKCIGPQCNTSTRRLSIDYEDYKLYQKLNHPIPKLVPSAAEAQAIQDLQGNLGNAMQGAFWGPLILQIFLSKAMGLVWIVFNALQLIVAMKKFKASFPANIEGIYGSFDDVVNMKMLPKEDIYDFFMGSLVANLPKSEDPDTNLILQVLMTVVAIFVFCIGICCLHLCMSGWCRRECCWSFNKIVQVVKRKLMYNSILRMCIQTYLQTSISCMKAISTAKFISWMERISTVVTVFILFYLITFPLFQYKLLRLHRSDLPKKDFRASYGALYQNLDVYKLQSLPERLLFLFRRLVFGLTVIMTFSSVAQVALTVQCSLWLQMYNINVKPMNSRLMNIVQISLEFCVYFCIMTLFWFTEFVADTKVRYQLGWWYLYFTLTIIGFSLLLIFGTLFVNVYVLCRRRKERKRQTKIREEKRQAEIKKKEKKEAEAKMKKKRKRKDFLIADLSKERKEMEELKKQHQKIVDDNKKEKMQVLDDKKETEVIPQSLIEEKEVVPPSLIEEKQPSPKEQDSVKREISNVPEIVQEVKLDDQIEDCDQNEPFNDDVEQIVEEDEQQNQINHDDHQQHYLNLEEYEQQQEQEQLDYQMQLEQEQEDILYLKEINRQNQNELMNQLANQNSQNNQQANQFYSKFHLGRQMMQERSNQLSITETNQIQQQLAELQKEAIKLDEMLQDNIDKMYNEGPQLASNFNQPHKRLHSSEFRSTNDHLMLPSQIDHQVMDMDQDYEVQNASRHYQYKQEENQDYDIFR